MSLVAVDLLDVYSEEDGRLVTTLAWGDGVEMLEQSDDRLVVGLTRFVEELDGSVAPVQSRGIVKKPSRASGLTLSDLVSDQQGSDVLKVDFVDVQQGDGSLIETPGGRVVLVDGGDNQLFARYLANRYRGTSAERPKEVDCIVVTHGDADHFAGLTEIHKSEKNDAARKRLFIHPRRVYHNGLVKRPSSVSELKSLGATETVQGRTVVTGLVTDLLDVPDGEMNRPFREWKEALAALADRGPIDFRRLAKGDDDAFDFLRKEGIDIAVLGPIETDVNGEPGLEFLRAPPPRVGARSDGSRRAPGRKSASHTINGHSIVFRLQYGDWSFLYAGDLNEPAEKTLVDEHARGAIDLRAEVFKVPHHGSADFSSEFFAAVSPVVSVVSSGDESARKEYIHPRATLMSALGRHGRGSDALVFVTELVAFFQTEGWVQSRGSSKRWFFGFSRAAFGLVRVRTDGKRLLVYTNSGQTALKEAYAYRMQDGEPVAVSVRRP
jgi:beta-lactamase superfamily II metal-dependent hydrolase